MDQWLYAVRIRGSLRVSLLKVIIRMFFFGPLLVLLMAHISLALTITSPNDGQNFNEGDTVNIIAELSPQDPEILYVRFFVTGGVAQCGEISTHPHYECSFTIPPASPPTIEIRAAAPTVDEKMVHSQKITLLISPPLNVILQGLRASNGNDLFLSKLGENEQLYIRGIYSDGIERRIESSALGTTYQTSDPKIAKVNPEGLVTAVGPGKAVITIKNRDKEMRVKVVVTLK